MRPQGEKWTPISEQSTVLWMASCRGPSSAGRRWSYLQMRTSTWQGCSVPMTLAAALRTSAVVAWRA